MNQALRELEFEVTTDSASTGRSLPLSLQSQSVGQQLEMEAIAVPELAATDPPAMPLQTATVSLKLHIEHSDPATRRKLRRAIETDCLDRYHMQKAGGKYQLTIPYDDNQDLAWQIDWLRGEMAELAEGEGGAISANFREEGTERQW